MDILASLGVQIQSLRKIAELTQEDLAGRARIDPKHLQDLEHGRANPTLATLLGVARGLNLTLSKLFDGIQ